MDKVKRRGAMDAAGAADADPVPRTSPGIGKDVLGNFFYDS